MIAPGGAAAMTALGADGHVGEFIRDQHRHCKPMLAVGEGGALVAAAGIPTSLTSGKPDPGVIVAAKADAAIALFLQALAAHRQFERAMDPPPV